MASRSKSFKLLLLWSLVSILIVTAPLAAPEGPVTVTGVLQLDSEGGLILKADGQTYLVEGPDMDAVIGKTIKVTALMDKSQDGVKYLIIQGFEEVKK